MTDATPSPDTPRRFRRYLASIAALFLLLYLLPFFFIRAPRYVEWTTSAFGRNFEYGFTATGIDADVVILGDSTALYGVDTRSLSQQLGVKAFNLPNIQSSILALGDIGFKRYLEHNRPPRVLVLYLAPWDLDFAHQPFNAAIYDGEEMLLRHGTFAELVSFYRIHFDELLAFPFKFYRVQSPSGLRYLFHPHASPPDVAATLGHLDRGLVPSLRPDCRFNQDFASRVFAYRSDQELIARYSTPQTRVLVQIAPIARCTGSARWLREDYAAIPAAPPRLLDPHDVIDDSFFAHLEPSGVPIATRNLAEALRPLLH